MLSHSVLTPGWHFIIPIHSREAGGCPKGVECMRAVRIWSPLTRKPLRLTLYMLPLEPETKKNQTAQRSPLKNCTNPSFRRSACLGEPGNDLCQTLVKERLNYVMWAQISLLNDRFSKDQKWTIPKKVLQGMLRYVPKCVELPTPSFLKLLSVTVFNQIFY